MTIQKEIEQVLARMKAIREQEIQLFETMASLILDTAEGHRTVFDVEHPGERAAGILAFTDTVTLTVESGDPGGEDSEFATFMENALREWFGGKEEVRTC